MTFFDNGPSLLQAMAEAVRLHKEHARLPAEYRIDKQEPSDQASSTHSALLRLACKALDLHAASLTKGVVPRDGRGHSQPLTLAMTALETAKQRSLEGS
jgi:hypothetical protein